MIKLYIEYNESEIIPVASNTDVQTSSTREEQIFLPKYNDANNMEFVIDNILFKARLRTSKDTCEKHCLVQPYCKRLRCTPSMTTNEQSIIFDTAIPL